MNTVQRKWVIEKRLLPFIEKYKDIDKLDEEIYEQMYADMCKVAEETKQNKSVINLFNCLYALFDDKEQEKT